MQTIPTNKDHSAAVADLAPDVTEIAERVAQEVNRRALSHTETHNPYHRYAAQHMLELVIERLQAMV